MRGIVASGTQPADARATSRNLERVVEPRGARLEYWFFKVNAGRAALLVDWIVRRDARQATLRVGTETPEYRSVIFDTRPAWSAETRAVTIGDAVLGSGESRGRTGDVAWDLHYDAGPIVVAPQEAVPLAFLRPLDMELLSLPEVRFAGHIEVRGRRYAVEDSAGTLSHYMGRRLPREWWWVSASQFDEGDVSVESTLARTRVFGSPLSAWAGYLYLRYGRTTVAYAAPFGGGLRVDGDLHAFVVTARPRRGPQIAMECGAGTCNDLGESILNTLRGDLGLMVEGVAVGRCTGRTGLERRAPAR